MGLDEELDKADDHNRRVRDAAIKKSNEVISMSNKELICEVARVINSDRMLVANADTLSNDTRMVFGAIASLRVAIEENISVEEVIHRTHKEIVDEVDTSHGNMKKILDELPDDLKDMIMSRFEEQMKKKYDEFEKDKEGTIEKPKGKRSSTADSIRKRMEKDDE